MRFTYTYRSSDGQRHSAEIDAPDRDKVFALLREERGIRPIKVVAADGSRANGEVRGVRKRAVVVVSVVSALAAGVFAFWAGRRVGDTAPYSVATPQGPVTFTVAIPLPRQAIPGSRIRIESLPTNLFSHAAEFVLAKYAEPGREMAGGGTVTAPDEADWRKCFSEPIRIASNELTEHIDLKRIVAGMKQEMRAYLVGGGTVQQYLTELEKRQRLEISYRERAEQKLNEMLNRQDSSPRKSSSPPIPQLRAAYAYWLKANAQLKAMGIYELSLPDILRRHQMSLDLDE